MRGGVVWLRGMCVPHLGAWPAAAHPREEAKCERGPDRQEAESEPQNAVALRRPRALPGRAHAGETWWKLRLPRCGRALGCGPRAPPGGKLGDFGPEHSQTQGRCRYLPCATQLLACSWGLTGSAPKTEGRRSS